MVKTFKPSFFNSISSKVYLGVTLISINLIFSLSTVQEMSLYQLLALTLGGIIFGWLITYISLKLIYGSNNINFQDKNLTINIKPFAGKLYTRTFTLDQILEIKLSQKILEGGKASYAKYTLELKTDKNEEKIDFPMIWNLDPLKKLLGYIKSNNQQINIKVDEMETEPLF